MTTVNETIICPDCEDETHVTDAHEYMGEWFCYECYSRYIREEERAEERREEQYALGYY